MKIKLAALGFAATVAQIVLLRELEIVFNGNELVLGLILAAWLAWTAAGAWGLGKWIPAGRTGLEIGLAGVGVFLAGQVVLGRGLRGWLGVIPGAEVGLAAMILAIVLILAPLCLLGGWLFTTGAKKLIEQGGTAGQAYTWESIGAVIGGASFSFGLIHWLNPIQTALFVESVILALLAFPWVYSRRNLNRLVSLFSALAFALLLLLSLSAGNALHWITLRWQWQDLVFAADSPYGRITVQARESQRIFFVNGLLAFETQGTFAEEVVHFPLLLHPEPRQVLLVGGGLAGDVGEILKHPVAQITYVELDPLLIRAAGEYLPPEEAKILQDERVTLALTDGRVYIRRAPASTFDVIILDLPEPSTGALNRYFTREFFAEAHRLLKPGGILATGLPSAENYWSPELARRNASLYRTIRAVFPQVLALPGEHTFFVASEVPLDSDPALLAVRLAERGVATRWVTPEYLRYVLSGDRADTIYQQLESVTDARLNTDLAPACYFYDLALWLSRLSPRLGRAFGEMGRWRLTTWGMLLFALPLMILVMLGRIKHLWRLPMVVAGTGLAQMTLQVVILFAFQVQHGSLYAGVALLVTAFMAGLAGGGATSSHWLASGQWIVPTFHRVDVLPGKVQKALLFSQIGIVFSSALFALLLMLPLPVWVFPTLALLAGGLAGMAFPLAVRLAQENHEHAVGQLYGSDLLGGCLGALLAATILIPILGLMQTCGVIALVGAAVVLLIPK